MLVRPILSVAVVAAALAGAAPAGAATVTVDRTCYSPGELISELGRGFAPGAQIVESLNGTAAGPGAPVVLGTLTAPPVTADVDGFFARRMRAPELWRARDRREQMVAAFADQATPAAPPATVQWTLSRWAVTIAAWRNGRGDPAKRMLVDTYGWTSVTGTLYAHYFRSGKPVGRIRIGALRGACGDLRTTVRQFPRGAGRPGSYTVYFTNARTFDRELDVYLRKTVRVPRR
jgi:hypothetical protein